MAGVDTVDVEAVAAVLAERLGTRRPKVLMTLGSGLGELADGIADALIVNNRDIGLPDPTVPGHTGRLVSGTLGGVEVLAAQGRVHLYEGVDVGTVTACVEAAGLIGVETFVVTNAAGGLNTSYQPGDMMLISDQLNLTGASPLIGLAQPHFLDMAGAYDPALRRRAHEVASHQGQSLHDGVYAGLVGPAFETPAEVNMLRTLGADAVGMSTVSEVIAARARGLRVVGFSLITNVHRPGGTPTTHAEVLEASAEAGPRMAAILEGLVERLE